MFWMEDSSLYKKYLHKKLEISVLIFHTSTLLLSRLPEVTRLDLSYNPMTYLGEESVIMSKLTHLFLDHMSLQDLSNTAVSKSPSLTQLDISHNQLRVIQPFSEGTPKLARLNLGGNPIYCNCYLRPLRYSRPLWNMN